MTREAPAASRMPLGQMYFAWLESFGGGVVSGLGSASWYQAILRSFPVRAARKHFKAEEIFTFPVLRADGVRLGIAIPESLYQLEIRSSRAMGRPLPVSQ